MYYPGKICRTTPARYAPKADKLKRTSKADNISAPPTAPLVLVPPKGRPRRSAKKEPTLGHAEVKAHYLAEHKRIRGIDPVWGAAEARNTNVLLEKLKGNSAECCRRITIGLEGWTAATILTIAGNPDGCAVAKSTTGFAPRKNAVSPQRGRPDSVKDGSLDYLNASGDE